MKKLTRMIALMLTVCMCFGLLPALSVAASAKTGFVQNSLTRTQMETLVQQTALAYFYKGSAVQYDSYYLSDGNRYKASILRQTNNRDPEDASDLNPIYTVCSAFPHDVYYSIFGKHILTNSLARPGADLSYAGVDMTNYTPNDPVNNYAEAILNVTSEYTYHGAMAAQANPSWDLTNPNRDTSNYDPSSPYADVVYYFGPEVQTSGKIVITATKLPAGTQRVYTISGNTATVAGSINANAVDANGAALALADTYTVICDAAGNPLTVQIKTGTHTEDQTVLDEETGAESTIQVEVDDFTTYYAVGFYDTDNNTNYYYISDADYSTGTSNPISSLTRADVEMIFAEKLRPGDILVARLANSTDSDDSSGGHAMLYLGDIDGDGVGEIAHSWGQKYNNDKSRTGSYQKNYVTIGTYNNASSADRYYSSGYVDKYYYNGIYSSALTAKYTSSSSGTSLLGYDLRESARSWYSGTYTYGNNYNGASGTAFVGRNGGGSISIEDWTTRLGCRTTFNSYSSKINANGTYGVDSPSSNYFKLKASGASASYYPGGDGISMTNKCFQFTVLRPLNRTAFTSELSPSAQARQTLKDLGVTKTSTKLPTWKVGNGTEITFNVELVGNKANGTVGSGRTTTTIANFGSNYDSTSTYTVNVTEYLPNHATFVSADNGGSYNSSTGEITWSNVSVANGATVNLQYTVAISGAERFDSIVSPQGKVAPTSGSGYLSTSEISYIAHGGALYTAQSDFIKNPTGIAAAGSGIDVANRIYQGAGVNLTLPDIDAMVDTLFEKDYWEDEAQAHSRKMRFRDPSELTGDALTLRQMVVNGYVGGKQVMTYDENGRKTNMNRLRDLAVNFLGVGDILVYANFNKYTGFYDGITDGSDLTNKVYVYLGSNTFAYYDDAGTYQTINGQTKLVQYSSGGVRFTYSPVVNQAFLYDCFFLLRPTQGASGLKTGTCDLSGLTHEVVATLEESSDGGETYGAPVEYGTLAAAAREEMIRTQADAAAGTGLKTYKIELYDDAFMQSSNSIYGNCILNLNGHTIRGTKKSCLNVYGATSTGTKGTAYINNGTIFGAYTGIYLGNQEYLQLDGVTAIGGDTGGDYWQPGSLKFWGHGVAKNSGSKLFIKNSIIGTNGNEKPIFTGRPAPGYGSSSDVDNAITIIDNVTFYTPQTLNGGENAHSGWDKTGGHMTLRSGVKLYQGAETVALPGGTTRTYDVLTCSKNEAKIGDTKYTTLGAALTAANANDTIEIFGNINLASDITVNPGVTLDVGTHSITGANVYVKPGATYKYTDGTGEHSVLVPTGVDSVSFDGTTYDKFIVDPQMQLSQSLQLVDDIKLQALVNDRGYNRYYAWLRWTDDTTGAQEAVKTGMAAEGGYKFVLTGKNAYSMAERHALTVVGIDASGKPHIAESKNISIQDYADAILTDYVDWENEDNNAGRFGAKLGRSMVAMLEYGTSAQKQFGYMTSNYANANLTAAMLEKLITEFGDSAITSARSEAESGKFGAVPALFYATSCTLGENLGMRFYFKTNGWTEEEIRAFTVEYSYTDHNGVEHTGSTDGYALDKNAVANFYSYKVGGLVAADVTCPIAVTLKQGETVLVTVWDSIANYSGRFKNAGSSGAVQQKLADDIVRYGLAARDYFGSSNVIGVTPIPEEGEFEIIPFSETEYLRTKINLRTDTSLYKSYGRSYTNANGLVMLWAGNAVEFTADCKGTVKLNYTAEENGYLRTYVDGVEALRPRITTGTGTVTVASGLTAGTHTIRIVRDSDISIHGYLMSWNSIELFCDAESITAPADKDLLIEYIGDSITVGKGAFSNGGVYTGDDPAHAATYAYSYVSAQTLNADWRITARGGIGFVRTITNGGGSCPKTMAECYDYIDPFAGDCEGTPTAFSFARPADIVILALGTNDTATGTTFKNAVRTMISKIRTKNGATTPIVIQYGMMTQTHADELAEVAGEYDGVYSLAVTQNNGGGSSSNTGTKHPSAEGHAVIAGELVTFLQNTVIPTLS